MTLSDPLNDCQEFVRNAIDLIKNLHDPDRVTGNPVFHSRLFDDYRRRHPHLPEAQSWKVAFPVIEEVVYRDLKPASVLEKPRVWREYLVLVAKYLPLPGQPIPPRLDDSVQDLLMDETLFQSLVGLDGWERVMQALGLDHAPLADMTYERAKKAGLERLANAMYERELALRQQTEKAQPPFWLERYQQWLEKQWKPDGGADLTGLQAGRLLDERSAVSIRDHSLDQPIAQAFSSPARLALVSAPFSGKTETLCCLALQDLSEEDGRVPCWVSLPLYASQASSTRLRDYVFETDIRPLFLCEDIGEIRTQFTEWEQQGRVVYYLDDWERLTEAEKLAVAGRLQEVPTIRIALWTPDRRLPLAEDGYWELAPLSDLALYQWVKRALQAGYAPDVSMRALDLLDREPALRELVKKLPGLVVLVIQAALNRQAAAALVVSEAILTLFRSIPAEINPETGLRCLVAAVKDLLKDGSDEIDQEMFLQQAQVACSRVGLPFNPFMEAVRRSGLLLTGRLGTLVFPFAGVKTILQAIAYSNYWDWYAVRGWIPGGVGEVERDLIRQVAVLKAASPQFPQYIETVARLDRQSFQGIIWTVDALWELHLAGLPIPMFQGMQPPVLSWLRYTDPNEEQLCQLDLPVRIGLLAERGLGREFKLAEARFWALAFPEEAVRRCFNSDGSWGKREIISDEITFIRLACLPTPEVRDALVDLIQNPDAWYGAKRSAIKALLEMPGEMGMETICSIMENSSQEVCKLIQEILDESPQWLSIIHRLS